MCSAVAITRPDPAYNAGVRAERERDMSAHATATKSLRINLRLTPCAGGKLRYVASTTQTSLSDFVLASWNARIRC